MPDESLLDNPIYNSLLTTHAPLAFGANTLARRYPSNIGPLAGFSEPTDAAYADLATLIPAGDLAVLFLDGPATPPAGWHLVRDGLLTQMICRTHLPPKNCHPSPQAEDPPLYPILPLTPADHADMLALATLTEPGPFRADTATLGGFLGIRVDGHLVAMAGHRTAPTGFTEISAVCTHPDHRGKAYALALVTAVAQNIHASGNIPFLTSFADNPAIRVYEQAGFTPRRHFQLAALKPPPPSL